MSANVLSRLSARLERTRALRASDVQSYRICDDISGLLIWLMVVFTPWAFGTTEPWSIWTMNVAGYLLGALWAAKLAIRRLKRYRPSRWDAPVSVVSGQRSVVSGSSFISHLPTSKLRRPTSIFHLRALTEPRLTTALALLNLLILAFCLISAVNASSTYHRQQLSFEYHRYLKWLPHSFDSGRTWSSFWSYLGLACSFWAVRDWLLGKSSGEERAEHQQPGRGGFGSAQFLPTRLRRLLWVLAVNGGMLGLEGIVQRLEGSGRLLFFIKPPVNPEALAQFGPYAYRGNAASYFNLLWPVCLGFWWTLQRQPERVPQQGSRGHSPQRHHLLLVCGAVMAACPIVSTSRGGALVTVGIVALAALFLLGAQLVLPQSTRLRRRRERAGSGEQGAGSGKRGEREQRGKETAAPGAEGEEQEAHGTRTTGQNDDSSASAKPRGATPLYEVRSQRSVISGQKYEARSSEIEVGSLPPFPISHLPTSSFQLPSRSLILLGVCFAAALTLGFALGWKALKPRMAQIDKGFEGREEMNDAARPMAADYPLFGTGPGTFEYVFQLYRASTDTYWPAQLHNDWLETRITFGWIGSGLIGLALVAALLRWFAPGGIHGGRRFVVLIWLALAGCLVHARYDFPFQIYSIVFLFLVLCAVLSVLSREPSCEAGNHETH